MLSSLQCQSLVLYMYYLGKEQLKLFTCVYMKYYQINFCFNMFYNSHLYGNNRQEF